MNKMFAITIGLAMLMAAPLSVMAQVTEPAPGPDEPIYPDDPGYNYTDPYWYYWPEQGGFDYDDGVANGTYVDFLLNETTGTISDYTAKLVDYNYYYPMVYAEGDRNGGNGYGYGYGSIPEPTEYVVTFFDSIEFEDFTPNGHPGVFGQSMVFLGENVMMTFGDYEWSSIYFQFGEDNGTMRFEVPEGFEINKTPYYYALYDITDSAEYGFSQSDSYNVDREMRHVNEYAVLAVPGDHVVAGYRPALHIHQFLHRGACLHLLSVKEHVKVANALGFQGALVHVQRDYAPGLYL
jgi:hypothetical protein